MMSTLIPIFVREIITAYLSILIERIQVQKVVLFGDYAKGLYKPESDINIAVFSTYFDGMTRLAAVKLLFALAPPHLREKNLLLYPFSYQEYLDRTGFTADVLEDSIEVYDQISGIVD